MSGSGCLRFIYAGIVVLAMLACVLVIVGLLVLGDQLGVGG